MLRTLRRSLTRVRSLRLAYARDLSDLEEHGRH